MGGTHPQDDTSAVPISEQTRTTSDGYGYGGGYARGYGYGNRRRMMGGRMGARYPRHGYGYDRRYQQATGVSPGSSWVHDDTGYAGGYGYGGRYGYGNRRRMMRGRGGYYGYGSDEAQIDSQLPVAELTSTQRDGYGYGGYGYGGGYGRRTRNRFWVPRGGQMPISEYTRMQQGYGGYGGGYARRIRGPGRMRYGYGYGRDSQAMGVNPGSSWTNNETPGYSQGYGYYGY